MNTLELCQKYNFNLNHFNQFIMSHNFNYTTGSTGMIIDDADIPTILNRYQGELFKLNQGGGQPGPAGPNNPYGQPNPGYQSQLPPEEIARRQAEMEERRKKKALSEMLITSGFNFDGYKITRYSGYISGDDCVTIPRDTFWGDNKLEANLCGALVKVRRQAIKELKEAAYNLGCNAVIGVDFDYLTMDPQHSHVFNRSVTVYEPYVICVTANGNAVVIEKEATGFEEQNGGV